MFRTAILGAPGSGKGTISNRLVRDFALKHLSMGDILREKVIQNTALGVEANKYMKAGKLVPDDIMVKLAVDELKKYNKSPWLLDGFPRTVNQATSLNEHQNVDLVISLEVPSAVIMDRVKDRWVHIPSGRIYNTLFNPPKVAGKDDVTGEELVQREDDKPESVMKRLQIYADYTTPVKKFYEGLGILKEFHGTESNEIYPRVKDFMTFQIERSASSTS